MTAEKQPRPDPTSRADELLALELSRARELAAQPQRRGWLLVLSLLLALGAGGAYFWKYGGGARGEELLLFTSLYVASPLALAVLAVFAYIRYPKQP